MLLLELVIYVLCNIFCMSITSVRLDSRYTYGVRFKIYIDSVVSRWNRYVTMKILISAAYLKKLVIL